MSLTEIEYGSLASSAILNQNFQYLDDRISSLAETHTTDVAGISSNIVTINNSITDYNEQTNSNVEEINTKLDDFDTSFSENGLYITLYKNGSSWYREYFSDKEKKNRVWLEQGGIITSSRENTYTLQFLKNFSNTNYCIFKNYGFWSSGGVAAYWMGFVSKTVSSAQTQSNAGVTENWYACGY